MTKQITKCKHGHQLYPLAQFNCPECKKNKPDQKVIKKTQQYLKTIKQTLGERR